MFAYKSKATYLVKIDFNDLDAMPAERDTLTR